ncbi:hypothetical protein [Lysinibacter cavernae]|uniref:Cell division protein CrgA n=1 Tax=Lysinibacter cavernae TaxID=1640652 RepID=A0A7X5R422_9MICO|nr:hypothetical protein [Lysinibacter cavernae]NIH55294.1 hypothetical protein [Lysinibacter cavernae]
MSTQVSSSEATGLNGERSSGTTSLVTVLGLIFAFLLVFGGFYVIGSAFAAEGYEAIVFGAGVLIDALGLWIAFWLISKID